MFGIDTIIGLASLAITIPGLVQTFVHAGRWLSEKLPRAPESTEIAYIQDFFLFLDRGTMRITLETVEDLYIDTPDTVLRSSLEKSAKQIWANMTELERQIRLLNSLNNNERQVKKATEAALATIRQIYDLETQLRAYVQVQIASRAVRSRFEFRRTQFCLIVPPTKLPYSTSNVALCDFKLQNRRGSETCLVQEKVFPGLSSKHAYESAVDLARTIQFSDSPNGLLELAGFQVQTSSPLTDDRFQFVFYFPKDRMNPRSFRDILLDPVNKPIPPIPRNYRFILPRKLAEAVYRVHQRNLVHKCIRPESLLLFEPTPGDFPAIKYPNVIGTLFLADWEHVRKTVEASKRQAYDDWTMAIYQHPARQARPGSVAESSYNIGHDIYSLGVCLLEIGLWDSFIVYCERIPRLSPLLSDAKSKWKRENNFACQSMTEAQIEQKVFITLAGERLKYEMGEAYSKLVIKCLACIEKGFGNVLKFVDSDSRDWDEQGDLFIQEIRRGLAEASTMGSGIYNRIA
ncbi:hypothetical protein N7462_003097 [Penicillium macrosclerotiorum]|uniref:uncharacterized protein n=1 Tax=Penicillium macrosclerotiorum TaxID=303699 RepID=UPI0025483B3D|nr:uncharacterized protein N7462_003097 [Penicillium macrosclerotiorum]KAJ5688705.1 hypothetical protein N7462_003097 [Penicillium macrosclerotiorum]